MEEIGFDLTGVSRNGGSRFWPHRNSLRNYLSFSVKLGLGMTNFSKRKRVKNVKKEEIKLGEI
jgi:hypothetical protein